MTNWMEELFFLLEGWHMENPKCRSWLIERCWENSYTAIMVRLEEDLVMRDRIFTLAELHTADLNPLVMGASSMMSELEEYRRIKSEQKSA